MTPGDPNTSPLVGQQLLALTQPIATCPTWISTTPTPPYSLRTRRGPLAGGGVMPQGAAGSTPCTLPNGKSSTLPPNPPRIAPLKRSRPTAPNPTKYN